MGRRLELDDRLYDYLLAHGTRETDLQRRLCTETQATVDFAGMQISPDQGQLMGFLARLIGARRALEIGTYTGYSALAVGLALPPDGRLICCDVNADWTAIARRYWAEAGLDRVIELRLAPALDTLAALRRAEAPGGFDFAFIDADKDNYDAYYEHCLVLVRRGGLIAIDNVLWSGRVAEPSVDDLDTSTLRALNEQIAGDARVRHVLLAISDGMTLARKR